MSKFEDYLAERLQDPAFKAEWDALEPEFTLIQAMIDAREKLHLTQTELSRKSGIHQSDISKIERGTANPSMKTLQRLASAMDCDLKIEFVPRGQ